MDVGGYWLCCEWSGEAKKRNIGLAEVLANNLIYQDGKQNSNTKMKYPR